MSGALSGLLVGLIERRHPPGYRGAVVERLMPLLRTEGARVDRVCAEEGLHRLDVAPPWDLVVLKSGSAAALHLAASAEVWGVPSVNGSEATRVAQDRLASAAILRHAGLPVAPAYLAWLGPPRSTVVADRRPENGGRAVFAEQLGALADRSLIVKSARGSRGAGLWSAQAGEIVELASRIPEGPYLVMERIPHSGDDLKVYVAGEWMAAVERPFPAKGLSDKLGRPARIPGEVAATTREAGRLLDLTCYGCDFVRGPDGWTLVDVNAFPGYKGAAEAPAALAREISRVALETRR